MELAQRVIHPHGVKYLLGKRGVPMTAYSRHPKSPLTPSVLRALDHCAARWFDEAGELRILRSGVA
jgi:hypothetical protein